MQSIPKKKLAAMWTHLDDVRVQAFCRAQPRILIGPDSGHLSEAREIIEDPPNAPMLTKGLFLLYLFRFRNTNRSENTRSFWINRNRNSIPVLVYKPGQSWFTLVYVGLPYRREPDKSSKYKYKQVGWDLFFLCWSIDVFVSFLVFVSSLENNLLRARLRRSTASATSESPTNYSSSCSASFSPLFPSKRTAVKTAAALHFLLVTMNTRSKTDGKERRR